MDLDDTELKTTTATEYRTPFGSMNDLRTENTENVDGTNPSTENEGIPKCVDSWVLAQGGPQYSKKTRDRTRR